MSAWKTEKLSNLLAVSIGGIWGEEAGVAEIDVSVVRVTELKAHGRIDPSSAVTRSVTLKQLASRELQEGDLLLEKSGGGPNSPVGRVGYFFQEGTRTVCSNFMQLMRPDSTKVLPKYLFYFLDGFHSNGGTIPMQTATTNIRNIKTPQYMDIDVPLPSIDEQHKIVELLEDHLSRLDAALADVKQAIIKAARFRQSLLNSVYFENEFPSVSLGTCIDLIMGQAPPGDTCNKDGKGTPFVKVGEFAKLYPTIEEWTLKPLRLAKTGDVLICVVGATVGKINLGIDCAIGRSVAAIRPKNILLQKYLYYFFELKMLEIRGQSKGSAQGVITKDYINSIQIPLPDLSAQQAILNLLESNFSQIEKSIEVSENIERESLSLRRSLLQAAFTGQLAKEVVSV
jgi:restriction endonuclease S subunit